MKAVRVEGICDELIDRRIAESVDKVIITTAAQVDQIEKRVSNLEAHQRFVAGAIVTMVLALMGVVTSVVRPLPPLIDPIFWKIMDLRRTVNIL